ncbi:hypothetical protein AV521_39050 [Streptomyces sp. IMTB 2501]|nr:hypothetical protein AV521_39050 [Streptomyces sp. IMTB 2501]
MIDQVEASSAERRRSEERMRRFIADAGHELRTPLASIAGYAELMNRGLGPGTADPAWRRIGAESARMTGLVEASSAERRRSEERMRRFIADAGHELRTPLASIAGYAELMNRGLGPGTADPAWRRIGAESARMTGLVENLLLLARLTEGRSPQSAEVDLAVVVAEAVRDARTAGADHVWRVELPLEFPLLVTGDGPRLRQAVAALLANARVHTPPGTTVSVAVETSAGHHTLRVRDDGPGIPRDLLPAVFDPFTRADASRTRTGLSEGGSGLGLAVAAAITHAHGGTVHVDSVPGRTEFTAEFPASDPSFPPSGRPAPARPPATGRQASRPLGSSA